MAMADDIEKAFERYPYDRLASPAPSVAPREAVPF